MITETEVSAKTKIIDNATRLFVAQGFAETSIAQIAKTADVTHSLIFHYFSNKQKLWQSCKEHFIGIRTDLIEQWLHQAKHSLEDFITIFVRKRFQFYKDNPDFVRLMQWQFLEEQTEGQLFLNNKHLKKVRSIISVLQKSNAMNDRLKPDTIISFISNLSCGYFLRRADTWCSRATENEYLQLIEQQIRSLLQPITTKL